LLSNAQLAELLSRLAEDEPADHRRRALQRAARAALFTWTVEASVLGASDRPLTELPTVGPWIARIILGLLEDPSIEPPEPPPIRAGYLTRADVRDTLAAHPEWAATLRGDLQMHTIYSDGAAPLRDMVGAAAELGYEFVGITDHSQGLKIARGMDERELAEQAADIGAVNRELEADGARLRVLHSIEMNLTPEGEGDMDPEALARLDLVLGAFHSNLRLTEDQTERYLAGVRNPTIQVLAHPRTRMFDRRLGLQADWRAVFAEVAALDKAVEIDASPHRQDLEVTLLELVREVGCRVSIGTDAHSVGELRYMEFGLAAAIRADIPRERILNFRSREEVRTWAESVRSS
jgi:histidinol phosphatase-like PHP family hydrolase